MADEGTHCPAVRHCDWPGGQVSGGRAVGRGVGRAVAKNKNKREMSFAQITFNVCKKERMYERKKKMYVRKKEKRKKECKKERKNVRK